MSRRGQQSGSAETQNRTESTILKPRMLCSHCGRTGHEKRDCYQIVGFPEWFPERNAGHGQSSGGRGRGGRSGGRCRERANVSHDTSSNSSEFPDFTSDQWKILTQMIQEKSGANVSDRLSGKSKLGDVILDTGASHYMTGLLSLLTNVEPISPLLMEERHMR